MQQFSEAPYKHKNGDFNLKINTMPTSNFLLSQTQVVDELKQKWERNMFALKTGKISFYIMVQKITYVVDKIGVAGYTHKLLPQR